MSNFLSSFLRVRISLQYDRMERASVLYTFILENLWTTVGLKVLFIIPSISENFLILLNISFSLS